MRTGFKQTRIKLEEKHRNMLDEITETSYFRKREGKGFVPNSRKVEFLIEAVHKALLKKDQDGI